VSELVQKLFSISILGMLVGEKHLWHIQQRKVGGLWYGRDWENRSWANVGLREEGVGRRDSLAHSHWEGQGGFLTKRVGAQGSELRLPPQPLNSPS